jgi:hypothetical protein
MKLYKAPLLTFVLSGSLAHAVAVTGTVTNQTNGKPSAGDTVVLVDVQAGMTEAATSTTDVRGHYSLETPGTGTYLIRVNHEGGSYFIAAPQNGSSANINVYDVAAKLDGVGIDADMLLLEAAGGMLRVQERYLVRNASLPPRAQFSANTFEIVIPADAELDGAAATRPGGLATNTRLIPLAQKGHYTFNVPIQPDQGEKETLFEVQYHIAYTGKYTLTPQLQMPADNLVVYVAKGIHFGDPQGATFQATQEDPRVQTFVAKNIHPGQSVSFTISGEGQMSRETQGPAKGQQAGFAGQATGENSGSGNGLDGSSESPQWFSKYKWWIVAPLLLLLASAAAFWLRKRKEATHGTTNPLKNVPPTAEALPAVAVRVAPPLSSNPLTKDRVVLLGVLKEELFAIESEKLSGTLSASEYTDIKRGLDAMLKRTLKQTS